ncbi:hypothetical protein PF008_g25390 [Phytophthora fragariae]|uniref:Uncharacterized protein n=1 Tax=Phytophthora fragariae TaxID=53985 RepID=A0A6G0QK45_9STRA|nr:hypothetical protein PF008_g25390 [Phytophthora fragariae]
MPMFKPANYTTVNMFVYTASKLLAHLEDRPHARRPVTTFFFSHATPLCAVYMPVYTAPISSAW